LLVTEILKIAQRIVHYLLNKIEALQLVIAWLVLIIMNKNGKMPKYMFKKP